MDLRKRLAHNLRHLMRLYPNLDTQVKVSKASHASQSTIQRVLQSEQAATVDLIERLARAFRITPLELLVENPDEISLLRSFRELSKEDQARVAGFIDLAGSRSGSHNSVGQHDFATRRPAMEKLPAIHRAGSRTSVGEIDLRREHEQSKRGKSRKS